MICLVPCCSKQHRRAIVVTSITSSTIAVVSSGTNRGVANVAFAGAAALGQKDQVSLRSTVVQLAENFK
jgi:hypothetical protein